MLATCFSTTPPEITRVAATRLAAHLGADRVEAGDGMPSPLARELRTALRAAQR